MAWVRLPLFFLLVVHKLCKFIRVVFAATMMLVFKLECANCQELRTSPSSARSVSLYLWSSNGSSLLCYAALTPRRPISSAFGALASRVCPIRIEPENQRLSSHYSLAPANRQTKLIEHYETRCGDNWSTGRYVMIYRRVKCLSVLQKCRCRGMVIKSKTKLHKICA